jgi:hypothetical protein
MRKSKLAAGRSLFCYEPEHDHRAEGWSLSRREKLSLFQITLRHSGFEDD